MFAIPGLIALILIDYLRPQEYLRALSGVPLLYLCAIFAGIGFVIDLRLGHSKLEPPPQLRLVGLFFVWCLLTLLVRAPSVFLTQAPTVMIPIVEFLLIAQCVQTFRMLERVAGLLLALSLVLAALGVYQGAAPWGCHQVNYGQGPPKFDGRYCVDGIRQTCEGEGAEPGADYICERVGLMGTASINGRVRFRGSLEDPNELSLALGIALPFAFAFVSRRPSLRRLLLLLLAAALVGVCAVLTQSRGGQVVFLVVLGAYFLRRYGARGLAVAGILVLPLLIYGGRGDPDAEASTIERLDAWYSGVLMFRSSPIIGVGQGQFIEHHIRTAHNSYVLTAAELGFPGMLIWVSILYLSLKIPIQALRTGASRMAPVAMSWSLALVASMAGLVSGVMFLSFAYKDILWIFLGLTSALYHAIRRHDPSFEVEFEGRELGLLAVGCVVLLIFIYIYTSFKL